MKDRNKSVGIPYVLHFFSVKTTTTINLFARQRGKNIWNILDISNYINFAPEPLEQVNDTQFGMGLLFPLYTHSYLILKLVLSYLHCWTCHVLFVTDPPHTDAELAAS